MIHYFNPGHEAAVLNASKYYTPAANQVKMQEDLAYLPAWYAQAEDYVLVNQIIEEPTGFPLAKAITKDDFEGIEPKLLADQAVDLWGISPQSIHLFEEINSQYELNLQLPEWNEEIRRLSSRETARDFLRHLIDQVPGIQENILPKFYSSFEDINRIACLSKDRLLIKAPYSSSGRGLLWIPPGEINRAGMQILRGMLNKQKTVSVEKALDKHFDFSMHFRSAGEVRFIAYSVFETNAKGGYERSLIASQTAIEQQIYSRIDANLIERVKEESLLLIREHIAPHYSGCIGIDMLVYQENDRLHLHPCVEINLRKSMGYLTLRLQQQYVDENSIGYFHLDFHKNPSDTYADHLRRQKENPIVFCNHKIQSGYLSLCPVNENTHYRAFLIIT